jgi:hypothetical protein
LRPGLLADGGNVELVGVDGAGVVSVLFQGACIQCPAQLATLRFVIEATLRKESRGDTGGSGGAAGGNLTELWRRLTRGWRYEEIFGIPPW